ncbi:hypothetical protein [Azospirillum argentinense]
MAPVAAPASLPAAFRELFFDKRPLAWQRARLVILAIPELGIP